MASVSTSNSQRDDNALRDDSIAPPRLPPPAGFQLPPSHADITPSRSDSISQHPYPRPPDLTAYDAEATEQRAAALRHLDLPPLDTSQTSHRSLSVDQLSVSELEYYPSKRRRVEGFQDGGPPNLVSRSDPNADSSSRLRMNAGLQQTVSFCVSDIRLSRDWLRSTCPDIVINSLMVFS